MVRQNSKPQTMRSWRSPVSADAGAGLRAAIAAGEAARDAWVKSGELVDAKALAACWLVRPSVLLTAASNHELLAVVHRRRRYYPCEFLLLSRNEVAEVSKALASVSPGAQLLFWKRAHGALGGRTAYDVLAKPHNGEDGISRVLALARAWESEATQP